MSTSPFVGCGSLATNPGLARQCTTTTICIGMRPSMKNDTGPANEPKSKKEMKNNETAMTRADETSPSAGWVTRNLPRVFIQTRLQDRT
jgi:hypothetical protein